MELGTVLKEVNRLRNRIKGLINSGQEPNQQIFQPVKRNERKMKIKNMLGPIMLVYNFIPSTQRAEAGRSLCLSPVWTTYRVSKNLPLPAMSDKFLQHRRELPHNNSLYFNIVR